MSSASIANIQHYLDTWRSNGVSFAFDVCGAGLLILLAFLGGMLIIDTVKATMGKSGKLIHYRSGGMVAPSGAPAMPEDLAPPPEEEW